MSHVHHGSYRALVFCPLSHSMNSDDEEFAIFSPKEIKWQDGPRSLPSGAKLAVFEGDPTKDGPFVMRLWLPDGYRVPPHTHPKTERLTVISGTFNIGMGEKFDAKAGREMPAGSFGYWGAGMKHFAWAKGETVVQLHGMAHGHAGIAHIVMLTGDNQGTADAIARETGVDEVHAELLPADKVTAVESLVVKYGNVAMVGDGVNDAPAMARATFGIAMGAAGSDAVETADIALMSDDLSKLPWLVRHSRRTLATIRQNIAFSLSKVCSLS